MLEVRQQPQHDTTHLASRASWTARICVHNRLPEIGLIMDFLSHLNAIFHYHSLYCDRTIFPVTYVFKLRYCYASHLRSLFQSLRLVFYFTLLYSSLIMYLDAFPHTGRYCFISDLLFQSLRHFSAYRCPAQLWLASLPSSCQSVSLFHSVTLGMVTKLVMD